MQIHHIAGYRFVALTDLPELRALLTQEASQCNLLGTILLSPEGINIMLAGEQTDLNLFIDFLFKDTRFVDMPFHKTQMDTMPFKHLKIKIKKEIITLKQPNIDVTKQQAPTLSPTEFCRWLDEKRDMTILDTRNDYEFQFGAFESAKNLSINEFSEFPTAIQAIPKNHPVVMYCTGGIRCEKAALVMMNAGYSEVYQLEGGILNYFKEVGDKHYRGNCFVFDERITVNSGNMEK